MLVIHDKHLDLTLYPVKPGQEYVCDKGCGVCEVKYVQAVHSNTKAIGGDELERRWHDEPVSACCGESIWIYDDELGLIDAYVRKDREKPAGAGGG